MEHYIRYFINRENRIESINDVWRSFAAKNGGEKLMNEMVLYRDISKFIACDRCQELYYMLLESIRASKKAIGFSFRCDSPETRRYMKMEMVPLEQGKVQFTSYLEREEARESLALLDLSTERTEEFVTICSWCKRIKTGDITWVNTEEAVEKMALFHKERLPKLSHGVCPVCYELLIKKIS